MNIYMDSQTNRQIENLGSVKHITIRKDIDLGIGAVLGASIQKLVNTPFFEEKIVLNVDFRPWGCFCSPYAVSAAPRPF